MNAPKVELRGCCPLCGSGLVDQFAWNREARVFVGNGQSVRFTEKQGCIVDALWRARNRGGIPSLRAFADLAWAHLEDGGAESLNDVSVHVINCRKKLQKIGFTITPNVGRPRQGFKLVRMADSAEVA